MRHIHDVYLYICLHTSVASESWAQAPCGAMNELAGGFYRGDRVLCDGRAGMIFGKPARAACVRISVSVMYDDGTAPRKRKSSTVGGE